jgi:hypothetical protein
MQAVGFVKMCQSPLGKIVDKSICQSELEKVLRSSIAMSSEKTRDPDHASGIVFDYLWLYWVLQVSTKIKLPKDIIGLIIGNQKQRRFYLCQSLYYGDNNSITYEWRFRFELFFGY